MAYLQLRSTNPNFSYILKKNPSSGMLIKPNRKGRLFGWYSDPGTYNIYFRDSDMESSYGKEDFEYMDVTRYNAPMFLLNAFGEFLNHMRKPDDKDVIGYEHILMINQMKCKPYNIEEFKSHFQDYEFKFEEVAHRNYRIEIKTKNTLRELINLGQIFATFNALTNNELGYVSNSDIDKYLESIKVVDPPYYIRHLFGCYFLRTQGLFNKYKVLLEKSEKAELELEFGNTLTQRMNAIQKRLDFKSHIVDIGCGEGYYVREFAPRLDKKINSLEYHAIDINPEYTDAIKRYCEKKEIENVEVWSSVDELSCPENSDILMTEVIEHMSKDDAAILINNVLGWPFRSIIITTPNKEFNSNYHILEDDVRHEGHVFEMTKEEFRIWLERLTNSDRVKNLVVEFFEIGDSVDGLRPTLAATIRQIGCKK